MPQVVPIIASEPPTPEPFLGSSSSALSLSTTITTPSSKTSKRRAKEGRSAKHRDKQGLGSPAFAASRNVEIAHVAITWHSGSRWEYGDIFTPTQNDHKSTSSAPKFPGPTSRCSPSHTFPSTTPCSSHHRSSLASHILHTSPSFRMPEPTAQPSSSGDRRTVEAGNFPPMDGVQLQSELDDHRPTFLSLSSNGSMSPFASDGSLTFKRRLPEGWITLSSPSLRPPEW